jgi:molybdopterin-binding protein
VDEASGRVQLAVYPWDITLAREQPDSSLSNHLRGTITSIVPLGDRARVRVGGIVAEITAASAARLGLREGDAVVASFKATAARLLPAATEPSPRSRDRPGNVPEAT